MACGTIATILLALVAQVHAEETQFEQALIDKLLDRVSALHDTDLDDATLGKAGGVQTSAMQGLGRRAAGMAVLPTVVAVILPQKPANAVLQPNLKFAKDSSLLQGINRRDEAMQPGGGQNGQRITKADFTAVPGVNPRGMNARMQQGKVDWAKGAPVEQQPKKNVGELPKQDKTPA